MLLRGAIALLCSGASEQHPVLDILAHYQIHYLQKCQTQEEEEDQINKYNLLLFYSDYPRGKALLL